MGANPELNALQKEVTRQRILETGFRVFAERTIDKVTMQEVADAAGIGVATVYRYYSTKPALVLGINGWIWERYLPQTIRKEQTDRMTAAQRLEYYLDTYLDLYRNHRDMLRFNQFFNIYRESEHLPDEALQPYQAVMQQVADRFHEICELGKRDGTIRTDVPEREMLFATLHLMLAAATRFAVGLAFDGGLDPERELVLLKNMLLKEYKI